MFVLTIISLLLLTLYGGLIGWYRQAWSTTPLWSPPATAKPPQTLITVLVPARNEEKNILTCLESLARQSYSRDLFDVIVIDDHSTDSTAQLVKEFAATAPFSLTCRSLSDHTGPVRAYKKFAIETGVLAARGSLIVTTDADCWFNPDWLKTIAAYHEATGAKFIAAPVRIACHRSDNSNSGFLFLLQTLDFITLQGITAASVARRFHSMCNGANLAYEKKAFEEVEGFRDIDRLPSGDDMLLMHKIYLRHPEKVFFLKSRHAIVSTQPERSWKGFVNQRIRWASKAASYDDRRIFRVLLLVYMINLLFPALLLAAWWNTWYLWLLLLLGMVKVFLEYPFVRSVAGFFGQQRLMVYFPALQPFHIAYTVTIGWLGQFGSYRWKDRKVKK
jgi:cellulose synthase/poly-beta-1,6-N-acetylglucosamine synthase-like glycosyltransferase